MFLYKNKIIKQNEILKDVQERRTFDEVLKTCNNRILKCKIKLYVAVKR